MLRAFSQYQLTTAHWMSLVQGLTLYELGTYTNGHPNAREACDLRLLEKKGDVARELQTKRLNQLLFGSCKTIGMIKADDEKKLTWAKAAMGCLADVGSQSAHQLSCLIFLGVLFDQEPLDILQLPEEGINIGMLVEGNRTLLSLYAKIFPVRVFKVINSLLGDMAISLEQEAILFRRLGDIHYAVDDQTRDSIEATIDAKLELIIHTESLHDLYKDLFPGICDAIMHIRHALSQERRECFMTMLASLIEMHDDNPDDKQEVRYARKTLATLKGVDDRIALSSYIQESYQSHLLEADGWLAEHMDEVQIPMIIEGINKVLADSQVSQERWKAMQQLSLIAYRLKQGELVESAKRMVDIYDREHEFFKRYGIFPRLLMHIQDDGIETVYKYVEEKDIETKQEIKQWILMHASTDFIKKIDNDLKKETLAWLTKICVLRVVVMGSNLPDDGWKLLLHVFTQGVISEYDIVALSFNPGVLEPAQQQTFIAACFAACAAGRTGDNAHSFVFEAIMPLVRCLSLMKNEEIAAFKAICEKQTSEALGANVFAKNLIRAIPSLDKNTLAFIKTLEMQPCMGKCMVDYAVQCAEMLAMAEEKHIAEVHHFHPI